MIQTIAPRRVRDQYGHMKDMRVVLRKVLDETPGSIRELAREAGVSHPLLVAIRDGDRRLTPETQEALAAALRRWAERCEGLAEDLEAAEAQTSDREGRDG